MNKTYKVIYNRTRCMYQVVSELAKGRTKSETPEMLKTVFSKHGSLARGIVMTVLSMSLAMPVGVAVQAEEGSGNTGSGDTTYISDTNTEVQNIQALDKQVVKNAQDIAANKTTTTTNTNNITANKTAIDKNTASIATNTSNIAANTGAISNETTARTKAISDLETKLTTGDNSLASKAMWMRPTSVRKLILPVKPPMKPKRKSRKTMPNSGVKPWVLGPLLMETKNCSLAEPCIRNCGLLKTVSIFITGNPLPTICWLWIQPSMPWVWKK